MTREENLQKIVLDSFYQHNTEITSDAFNTAVKAGIDSGFSMREVKEGIQKMDANHKGLLNVIFSLDAQGWGRPEVSNVSVWLSSDGEKYLSDLKGQKRQKAKRNFDKYVFPIITNLISAGIGALITWLISK